MGRLTSSSSGGNVTVVQGGNTLGVNSDGSINVVSSASTGTQTLVYAEAPSVVVGLETTILSYTVPGTAADLLQIAVAGQTIGEIRVYKNAAVIDKQYLYYTQPNIVFNYNNLGLNNGDVLLITCINNGQDVANFNANLQVLEK